MTRVSRKHGEEERTCALIASVPYPFFVLAQGVARLAQRTSYLHGSLHPGFFRFISKTMATGLLPGVGVIGAAESILALMRLCTDPCIFGFFHTLPFLSQCLQEVESSAFMYGT